MTSSQTAFLLRMAVVIVAALLLTLGQLRVLGSKPPRRAEYALAWLILTLVLGAFLGYMDTLVGRTAAADRGFSSIFAASVTAVALTAGARLSKSPFWKPARQGYRIVALFALHAVIVFLADSAAR